MPRFASRLPLLALAVSTFAGCSATTASISPGRGAPAYARQEVVYARPFGSALTLEVFTPRTGTKGAAVVIHASEGWFSDRDRVETNAPLYAEPLVAAGHTGFGGVHRSVPRYTVPETVEHLYRAVRFVRCNAVGFGIDPDRIGATGDSAGGHLAP